MKQLDLWALMLDLFPHQNGTFIEELRKMLAELTDAYDALPDSVRDDAAPEGASLADRIRAVVQERDQARSGWAECHGKHPAPYRSKLKALQPKVNPYAPTKAELAEQAGWSS